MLERFCEDIGSKTRVHTSTLIERFQGPAPLLISIADFAVWFAYSIVFLGRFSGWLSDCEQLEIFKTSIMELMLQIKHPIFSFKQGSDENVPSLCPGFECEGGSFRWDQSVQWLP
jgi:hypothetical protein